MCITAGCSPGQRFHGDEGANRGCQHRKRAQAAEQPGRKCQDIPACQQGRHLNHTTNFAKYTLSKKSNIRIYI